MASFATSSVGLPITALEFAEENIIVGEGPYLHVYDASPRPSSRVSMKVLSHQVVHGIRRGQGSVFAVFGQKGLAIVRIDVGEEKKISILHNVSEVFDWILDVCWLHAVKSPDLTCRKLADPAADPAVDPAADPATDPAAEAVDANSALAVVTGHNAILLWDVKRRVVTETVHCQENCILYSARFIGQNWSDLVLAAGTVFNQVVFWRPHGPTDYSGRVAVDHRVKGHQGVIFDISYNCKLGRLATVSDDRSIRLWRYRHPHDRPVEAELVLYGHSARVWCARILTDTIVSIGEDATCCVWSVDGRIVKKLKSHKGKSIWSLAVKDDGSCVATGGGDGSVRLWSLQSERPQNSDNPVDDMMDIQSEVKPLVESRGDPRGPLGNHLHGPETDFVPRTLAVSSDGQLLVMTQGGYLFSWSSRSASWRLVWHDGRYRSYSIMATAPSTPSVVIGNIYGCIKLLLLETSPTRQPEVVAYKGNVLNLIWASNEDVFSTGVDGQLIWWKVLSSSSSPCLVAHAKFTLPPCRQRWATSVVLLSGEEFVCGDRRGAVHLYRNDQRDRDKMPGPLSSVPGVHSKAGTSSVCLHGEVLYSTGRDGTYRQYSIAGTGELRLQNTYKVFKGFDWLEKLIFTEDGDILVLGFHSVNFVVWSTTNNEALLQVHCGGGHRAWDFAPLDDGSRAFVCIKMKQLLMSRVAPSAWQRQTILKVDVHGREITCVKFLRTVHSSGDHHHVYATGSEDTKVNIAAVTLTESTLAPGAAMALGEMRVLHRLHAHVSSVRALATCRAQDGGDSILLFSAGGRCSINCWRVKFSGQASGTPKRLCTVHHLVSHSSLLTEASRRRALRREGRLDPETRFMGVAVWRRGGEGGSSFVGADGRMPPVMVCVASSDALLRFFCFDEGACRITPLGSSNVHDCCHLTLAHLTLTSDLSPAILTGGTDGRISVWDVPDLQNILHGNDDEDDDDDNDVEEEEQEQEDVSDAGNVIHSNLESLQKTSALGISLATCQSRHGDSRRIAQDDGPKSSSPGQTDGLTADDVHPRQWDEPPGEGSAVGVARGLASWGAAARCSVVLSWMAHQSGVNALGLRNVRDNIWLVASGGDDNGITVVLLHFAPSGVGSASCSVLDTHKLKSPHAAQVTGIHFTLPNFTLLSVSVDQRLNGWEVRLSEDVQRIQEVKFVSSVFLHVPDVAAMDVWQESSGAQHVVVCGQGLQLLSSTGNLCSTVHDETVLVGNSEQPPLQGR